MTRLVEQEGPVAIHHQPLHGFIVSCADCRWITTVRARADAQDEFDAHRCERVPS